MSTRAELERDIKLHTDTLADPSKIKSEFHWDNVRNSLQSARDKLSKLESEK